MLTATAKYLSGLLFADPGSTLYAVLDGGSVEGLQGRLATDTPVHCCLYGGQLEADLAQTAPYLVQLEPSHPFCDWVLSESFTKHFGIFAKGPSDFRLVRRHFRSLLQVRDPENQVLSFRFYDPRVLSVYLPTCVGDELNLMFGPLKMLWAEEPPTRLIAFTRGRDVVRRRRYTVGNVSTGSAS